MCCPRLPTMRIPVSRLAGSAGIFAPREILVLDRTAIPQLASTLPPSAPLASCRLARPASLEADRTDEPFLALSARKRLVRHSRPAAGRPAVQGVTCSLTMRQYTARLEDLSPVAFQPPSTKSLGHRRRIDPRRSAGSDRMSMRGRDRSLVSQAIQASLVQPIRAAGPFQLRNA